MWLVGFVLVLVLSFGSVLKLRPLVNHLLKEFLLLGLVEALVGQVVAKQMSLRLI